MEALVLVLVAFVAAVQGGQIGVRTDDRPAPAVSVVGSVYELSDEEAKFAVLAAALGDEWRDSEDAKGILHTGDRLSLYHLTMGAVGELVLGNDGELGSEGDNPTVARGLYFRGRAAIRAECRGKLERADRSFAEWPNLVAASSSAPSPPRWVQGELLDPADPVHRETAIRWLTDRGVAADVLETVILEQVVRADTDGDGSPEIFISLRSPDTPTFPWRGKTTERTFSYLIAVSPREGGVATSVVMDSVDTVNCVAGFCDVNGDGRAEVVTSVHGVDIWGSYLCRRKDSGFEAVGVWGGGA